MKYLQLGIDFGLLLIALTVWGGKFDESLATIQNHGYFIYFAARAAECPLHTADSKF